MTNKTPWERSAESSGTTASERYLSNLARKAFLSLWSYSNLFTDEGRSNGKGDGKELCDLVVIFGNNVLLFSDKHCEFPVHQDIKVAWSRWYRRAVEKSVRQLIGAEKFLRANPARIYLDKNCSARLPIDYPAPEVARYFLIAVTRGSYAAAKQFWGGRSSGSLLLDSSIEGDTHTESPFRIGFPAQGRRFVHVLDEMTIDVLLEELDTVPDLVAYLSCKEAFMSSAGVAITVAGEEDLLARYMCTMKDGNHSLPDIPDDTSYLTIVEGDWEFYSTSPQRAAKVKADTQSYMWDALIEHQSSFIRSGKALSLPDESLPMSDHEHVVRAMADETRLARRQLATDFRHALNQSERNKKFARISMSGGRHDRAYVFLTAPKPDGVSYQEYREMRSMALLTYCHGVKLKFPWVAEAVGIASEPMSEAISSQDFLYVELGSGDLEVTETDKWQQAMEELDVLQAPTMNPLRGREHEFPMPFNFSRQPEFYSAMPMNRAQRRATAKQERRKPR